MRIKKMCDGGCGTEIGDDGLIMGRKRYCRRCYEEVVVMLTNKGEEWKGQKRFINE